MQKKGETQEIWGQWSYFVWHCNGRNMAFCISQNSQNFKTKYANLIKQNLKSFRWLGDSRVEGKQWLKKILTALQMCEATSHTKGDGRIKTDLNNFGN